MNNLLKFNQEKMLSFWGILNWKVYTEPNPTDIFLDWYGSCSSFPYSRRSPFAPDFLHMSSLSPFACTSASIGLIGKPNTFRFVDHHKAVVRGFLCSHSHVIFNDSVVTAFTLPPAVTTSAEFPQLTYELGVPASILSISLRAALEEMLLTSGPVETRLTGHLPALVSSSNKSLEIDGTTPYFILSTSSEENKGTRRFNLNIPYPNPEQASYGRSRCRNNWPVTHCSVQSFEFMVSGDLRSFKHRWKDYAVDTVLFSSLFTLSGRLKYIGSIIVNEEHAPSSIAKTVSLKRLFQSLLLQEYAVYLAFSPQQAEHLDLTPWFNDDF